MSYRSLTQGGRGGRSIAEGRRRQIIEAATRIFSDQGFDRATLQVIAGVCGLTEPALYRHFRSKEALYAAVLLGLKDRLGIASDLVEIAPIGDLETTLTELARTILRRFGAAPEIARLLYRSSLDGHPLARQAFLDLRAPYVVFLERRFREQVEAGRVREIHPDIAARAFVGLAIDCAFSSHLWRDAQGRDYEDDRVIRNIVLIYARGIR